MTIRTLARKLVFALCDSLLQDKQSHSSNNKIWKIESIPRTMHYKNVRAVVSLSVWNKFCKATHNKNFWACQECGAKSTAKAPLENHEVWFYDVKNSKPTKVMRLVALSSLCRMCHLAKHPGFAQHTGQWSQVKQHVKTVYGLNDWQISYKLFKAKTYMQFYNKFDYALDLTHLNSPRYQAALTEFGRSFYSNETGNCRHVAGNQ